MVVSKLCQPCSLFASVVAFRAFMFMLLLPSNLPPCPFSPFIGCSGPYGDVATGAPAAWCPTALNCECSHVGVLPAVRLPTRPCIAPAYLA